MQLRNRLYNQPQPLKDLRSISQRVNSSYLELGRVTRPNLGLIVRSACYSAGLGLVLSP